MAKKVIQLWDGGDSVFPNIPVYYKHKDGEVTQTYAKACEFNNLPSGYKLIIVTHIYSNILPLEVGIHSDNLCFGHSEGEITGLKRYGKISTFAVTDLTSVEVYARGNGNAARNGFEIFCIPLVRF